MIDWRGLLFWRNTDTDTAGCLSKGMAEWYMSITSSKQSKNRPHLQGDTIALTSICVHSLFEHVKHIHPHDCWSHPHISAHFILSPPLETLHSEVKDRPLLLGAQTPAITNYELFHTLSKPNYLPDTFCNKTLEILISASQRTNHLSESNHHLFPPLFEWMLWLQCSRVILKCKNTPTHTIS